MELYECEVINCATPEQVGPLQTNAKGEVFFESTLIGIVQTTITKQGFMQTALSGKSNKEDAAIYYMARPSWLHMKISNASPLTESDSCFYKMYQRDSLLVGYTPYQGVLDNSPLIGIGDYYLNGFLGTGADFKIAVAGGVYASLEVRVVRNGVSRDTVIPVFCPPNDTAFVHFEY